MKLVKYEFLKKKQRKAKITTTIYGLNEKMSSASKVTINKESDKNAKKPRLDMTLT